LSRRLREGDGSVRELILGIVESNAFLTRSREGSEGSDSP
jgi:hypothetical protein